MQHDEGGGEVDAARQVEEGAVVEQGGVQGGELLGARGHRLREEVRLHQVAVVLQGVVERVEDHPAFRETGGQVFPGHEAVVGEQQLAGLGELDGGVGQVGAGDRGRPAIAVEPEPGERGEAPGLVRAPR